MPARRSGKKTAAAKKLTTAQAGKLVKIDQLSKAVGTAVNRALAKQDLSGIRGPIICGIIFRPGTGTFSPVFREQQ